MESSFPANSNAAKKTEAPAQKKKIEKVIQGEVVTRKKPLSKRFRETFNAEDTSAVGSHILFEVIVPGAKDLILDGVTQALERKFYGEARSRTRRGNNLGGIFGNATYNAYNRYSSPGPTTIRQDPRQQQAPRGPRGRASRAVLDEIILGTRVEANEIIDLMNEIISQYGAVTVSDLFDMLGTTGEFTELSWGWTDLRGADVEKIREGYLLNLPRPVALD